MKRANLATNRDPPAMLFAIASAALLAVCPVDRAHYALRTMPGVTARFVPVPTDTDWRVGLALRMHVAATGRTYWWLPWNGGTDGLQHLASTADPATRGWRPMQVRPLGDVGFIATDARYTLIDGVPRAGGAAPAHFFVENLREAMWYRTPWNRREVMAEQFFDLVQCDRR
jgi:hypothetical protein